jgi:radical SAM protein with 4Fe4S-binding SPASM domain
VVLVYARRALTTPAARPVVRSPAGPPGPTGLVYVVWELTLRCDLACGHCGSRAGKGRADELSTAEALELVRQIAAMGAREVTLIGGEAYLRDDWTVIARAVREAGMTCTMTTGGRGLTPERARAAAEAGIASVSVSIDGIGPVHDLQRGVTGSFDAARAAIVNLAREGVRVTVNTQVNRLSFPELEAILDLLVEHGCPAWQVQLTVPMGRAADRPDWLLQPHDILHVIPRIAELSRLAAERGVELWPGNNVGYFGPHEAELRGRWTGGAHATGCSAGARTLGVEADGAIKGCPSLPTAAYTGGNVRERPVRAIWDETAALRFTRDRTVDDLWGLCRTCYYADVCRAGCTWTSHVTLGRPGNNPYCHHRALELRERGLRERLVQVEEAPGLPFDHGRFELVVEPFVEEGVGAPVAGRPAQARRRLPVTAMGPLPNVGARPYADSGRLGASVAPGGVVDVERADPV